MTKPVSIAVVFEIWKPVQMDALSAALEALNAPVSLFVNPQTALDDVRAWKQLVASGHEIGNAGLHGVTDDGQISNWTLRMIEQDLHMTQQFFSEIFEIPEPESFVLPGNETLCAQGDYLSVVESRFAYLFSRSPANKGAIQIVNGRTWLSMPRMDRSTDAAIGFGDHLSLADVADLKKAKVEFVHAAKFAAEKLK